MSRVEDLLADRALVGLGEHEVRELEQLTMREPLADPLALERVAAAVDLALTPTPFEPLPAALRQRLVQDAQDLFGAEALEESAPSATPPHRALGPWWLAAAASLLALAGWWAALTGGFASPVDAGAQRAELLARAGVTRVDWSPTELAPDVQGDVVWSQAEQRGFLRFEGLPVNDPAARQYQLWIFDDEQEHPIDGGVFDVATTGEVVIPIDSKLLVARPTLFAVTVEKPGGVVVSDRQRIAALGQI